ncbi:unnamed protein product [Brassica oleracea var. botrytis]
MMILFPAFPIASCRLAGQTYWLHAPFLSRNYVRARLPLVPGQLDLQEIHIKYTLYVVLFLLCI